MVPVYDKQLFITEVIKSYNTLCTVETSFYNFWLNKGTYDVIHLHWPEYLFKWKPPTDIELLLLEKVLKKWQENGAKIVITRHNYLPHQPSPERFEPLYEVIYKTVDAVIHLGAYSIKEYKIRYEGLLPKKQVQAHIPHPIFTNYPNTVTKSEARQHLNIGKDTVVMLVFGEVRKASEKNLVLEAFDAIDTKDKLLIAPGWKFSKTKEPINSLKWLKVKQSKKYRITQEFIKNQRVQHYFKAANFVFLPRIDTLNSGVPFLAAFFNTPIVGCKTGNITQVLKENGMPSLNVINREQIKTAINQVLLIKEDDANYAFIEKDNQAMVVGEKHLELFNMLINS
ncbi:hypothetical protein N9Q33_02505 [Flavobacteriaceae bacterium]|nr:hypothetical protein [Flavobacteriaceae bacterium]